ncbi:MAG: two-component sensor histidine kinase [Microbacteriaceae bacterium]|nr:two-component sensor histidine kinase [Microbacteriaceae bacterium]
MTPSPTITPGELAMPRPPGVFRRWMSEHPRIVDWIIVGTYLFGGALMLLIDVVAAASMQFFEEIDPDAAVDLGLRGAALGTPWLVVVAVCIALVALSLRYRRRYPLAGVLVISVVMCFDVGLVVAPNSVALIFLLFAVPIYRGVREAWIGYAAATLFGAMNVHLGSFMGLIGPTGLQIADGGWLDVDRFSASILNALWLLTVVLIGINLGNRKRYVQALIDRAHQLVREREQRAQLAAAEERARIAREMHDIVAHSLSVVVTLSEAASVSVDSQPAAAKHAMERAAETGRQSLHEMRRLLGVLNDQDRTDDTALSASGSGSAVDATDVTTPGSQPSELRTDQHSRAEHPVALTEPQPDLAQLGSLVDGFRDAGLHVTVSEQGVAHGDASHQLAVYRIAQEALTNALRYAGAGAHVSVTLTHDSTATTLTVTDNGSVSAAGSPSSPPPLVGSGRGLAGARERARLFGGSLDASPLGRGWQVRAHLPTDHRSEERTLA